MEAEREEEGAGSAGSAGVPAADPKMETEEKDTGSVGSAGVPATDPAPDEAVEESEFEPDWKATRKWHVSDTLEKLNPHRYASLMLHLSSSLSFCAQYPPPWRQVRQSFR